MPTKKADMYDTAIEIVTCAPEANKSLDIAAKGWQIKLNQAMSYPMTFMFAEGAYAAVEKIKKDNKDDPQKYMVYMNGGIAEDYLDALCDLTDSTKVAKPILESVLVTKISGQNTRKGCIKGVYGDYTNS